MQSINLEEPLEVRNYIFQNYNTHRPYEQQELFEEAAHGHLEAVKEIEKYVKHQIREEDTPEGSARSFAYNIILSDIGLEAAKTGHLNILEFTKECLKNRYPDLLEMGYDAEINASCNQAFLEALKNGHHQTAEYLLNEFLETHEKSEIADLPLEDGFMKEELEKTVDYLKNEIEKLEELDEQKPGSLDEILAGYAEDAQKEDIKYEKTQELEMFP